MADEAKLRSAGFSDAEIAQHSARLKLEKAGFSKEEIDKSFGAQKSSNLSNPLKPITDIPGNIAADFRKGSKEIAESIPKSGDDFGNPLGTVAGGFRQFFSPLTGIWHSVVGEPIRENSPDTRLGRAVANTAEQAGEIFIGAGPVAKGGKAVARTLSSAQKRLMDQGIRLTPGQMAGRTVKSYEDKATSYPIVGDAIAASRRQGIRDLNENIYNRALAPIGAKFEGKEVGPKGIAEVHENLDAAYEAIKPKLSFKGGPEFFDELKQLEKDMAELPADLQGPAKSIYDNRVGSRMKMGGKMDGEAFKQMDSELGHIAAQKMLDPTQRELGHLVQDLQMTLRKQLERSNPENAAVLADINSGWAIFTRIQNAASNRAMSGGIFTPGDLLAAVKKGDKSVRKGAFAENDALLSQIARDAGEVLPSTYPDSGSVGRILAAGGAAELLHHPEAILYAGGAALPFTPPAVTALNAARKPGSVANAVKPAYQQAAPVGAAAIAADPYYPGPPMASDTLGIKDRNP